MVRGFFYCCLDSGFDKLVSTSWFRQAGFDKLNQQAAFYFSNRKLLFTSLG